MTLFSLRLSLTFPGLSVKNVCLPWCHTQLLASTNCRLIALLFSIMPRGSQGPSGFSAGFLASEVWVAAPVLRPCSVCGLSGSELLQGRWLPRPLWFYPAPERGDFQQILWLWGRVDANKSHWDHTEQLLCHFSESRWALSSKLWTSALGAGRWSSLVSHLRLGGNPCSSYEQSYFFELFTCC